MLYNIQMYDAMIVKNDVRYNLWACLSCLSNFTSTATILLNLMMILLSEKYVTM